MIPLLQGYRPDGTPDPVVAGRAARAWLAGGLVGLPTETVYGLAADAQDLPAVARIFEAKGRPAGHPLIVHVQGVEAIDGWGDGDLALAHRLAQRLWPGPLTVIVPRSRRVGDVITGGQATVALRCPAHPVAHACIAALAVASGDPARGVAAPSANRFGRVSPTRAPDVLAELGDRLDPARDLVIDGGPAHVGVESTIVDCTTRTPKVLRPGAISQADVDAVLGWESGAAGAAGRGRHTDSRPEPVRAPGLLASHYAPAARVRLVDGSGLEQVARRGARVGLIAPADIVTPPGWTRLARPRAPDEYARELYAALRNADLLGLAEVVAVPPSGQDGLSQAVRDRLRRASHERPGAAPEQPSGGSKRG